MLHSKVEDFELLIGDWNVPHVMIRNIASMTNEKATLGLDFEMYGLAGSEEGRVPYMNRDSIMHRVSSRKAR